MRTIQSVASAILVALSLTAATAHAQTISATELAIQGFKAYQAKDYAKASELYQQALARGAKSSEHAYNGGCSAALAGNKDAAFSMLEKALALGFHDASNLKNDGDLVSLHSDERWPVLLVKAEGAEKDFVRIHSDPDAARFVTSDVDLFWKAYAELTASKDPVGLLSSAYLDPGTVGLQDFIPNRILSGKNLYETIKRYPRYFASIQANTLKVKTVESQARQSFHKLKTLYADATFPDVYFVIGAMNSGGTSTSNGLLLGAEMFGRGPGVPLDELDDWHKNVVHEYTDLPNIIAHELIHFQQRHQQKTLLAKAMHEGSADFVASLISDGNFNKPVYDYGYAHEAELWKQFQTEMNGSDSSKWLYGSSQRDGHPADLGYFMGFRISQAYYNQAKDKKQALRDILVDSDFEKILMESHYGEKF